MAAAKYGEMSGGGKMGKIRLVEHHFGFSDQGKRKGEKQKKEANLLFRWSQICNVFLKGFVILCRVS